MKPILPDYSWKNKPSNFSQVTVYKLYEVNNIEFIGDKYLLKLN